MTASKQTDADDEKPTDQTAVKKQTLILTGRAVCVADDLQSQVIALEERAESGDRMSEECEQVDEVPLELAEACRDVQKELEAIAELAELLTS